MKIFKSFFKVLVFLSFSIGFFQPLLSMDQDFNPKKHEQEVQQFLRRKDDENLGMYLTRLNIVCSVLYLQKQFFESVKEFATFARDWLTRSESLRSFYSPNEVSRKLIKQGEQQEVTFLVALVQSDDELFGCLRIACDEKKRKLVLDIVRNYVETIVPCEVLNKYLSSKNVFLRKVGAFLKLRNEINSTGDSREELRMRVCDRGVHLTTSLNSLYSEYGLAGIEKKISILGLILNLSNSVCSNEVFRSHKEECCDTGFMNITIDDFSKYLLDIELNLDGYSYFISNFDLLYHRIRFCIKENVDKQAFCGQKEFLRYRYLFGQAAQIIAGDQGLCKLRLPDNIAKGTVKGIKGPGPRTKKKKSKHKNHKDKRKKQVWAPEKKKPKRVEEQRDDSAGEEIFEVPEEFAELVKPVGVVEQVEKASDGSFVESDCNRYIEIKDPSNKVGICLCRVNNCPISNFSFHEDFRIGKWFLPKGFDSMDPFSGYDLSNYSFVLYCENWKEFLVKSDKNRVKKMFKIHHAFARAVDKYIFELGIKTDWFNNNTGETDINISIPGWIKYRDNKIEYGVFSYAFSEKDGKWTCYHRCFTDMPRNRFLREILGFGYWNVHMGGDGWGYQEKNPN
ncbi:hypothetical protein KKA53_01580 [Candidatus Dependentiae bacterium]|nr:hypothetical protein [Candidatus Dependentiae bacterium]